MDDTGRYIAVVSAANDLYFGDRGDLDLWEALRRATNFPTMEQLDRALAEQNEKKGRH